MKRVEDLEIFKSLCMKKRCSRNTMITPKCVTTYKQEDCWEKYNKKMDSGGYMKDRVQKPIKQKVPIKKVYSLDKLPLKKASELMPNSTLKRPTKPIKVKTYDPEYTKFRNSVWQRELKIDMPSNGEYKDWTRACQFWKSFSPEEKIKFMDSIKGSEWLLQTIQVCHIEFKSTHKELKYDPNNAVLGNHICHSRLDTYKDPVTGKDMTKEQRIAWLKRLSLSINNGSDDFLI
jgi:hypothetical protein